MKEPVNHIICRLKTSGIGKTASRRGIVVKVNGAFAEVLWSGRKTAENRLISELEIYPNGKKYLPVAR